MAREIRGDIQGLRAVAVLVVIGSHAGIAALPGGFVGVDVFFVVSGYLISLLLYRELQAGGRISVGSFWARRARRILPAATVVTLATVAVSVLWLSLLDARQVVVDALWAGAFAANVHFAQQGVYYFAQDTGPSPLQHYWSLAVEEQFYLVWPLLLLVCVGVTRVLGGTREQRLPRGPVFMVLLTVTGLSLAWSIQQTGAEPTAAYFSTLTRAWELGVGAMVALVPSRVSARLTRRAVTSMGLLGLAAIAASCAVLTADTAFPGYAALLPVTGTALLLLAGASGTTSLVGRALSVRPLRLVGDWSYSLYLWHWPVLVLAEARLGRGLGGWEAAAAVAVTFALSALTFRFVETPFRSGRVSVRLRARRALVLYPTSLAMVAATAWGAWTWTAWQGGERGDNPAITVSGTGHDDTVELVRASVAAARERMAVPSDLDPNLMRLRDSIADVGGCDYAENVRRLCQRGEDGGDRTLVLIGDSHARAWIPAFDKITRAGNWQAFYLVKPQCTAAHITVATADGSQPFTDCTDFQEWVVEQVEALDPDLVVVASSPPVNGVYDGDTRVNSIERVVPVLRAGYDELFIELEQAAREVVLMRDVPKSDDDPATCLTTGEPDLYDCMFRPVERSQILGDVAVQSARLAGTRVVDPTPWLCWQGECPVVIGGTLSYRDTDHITTEYAASLWLALGDELGMIPTT
ncbi:acyltransferase family protein [Nocardioides sp. SYSU D00038]|uniref:acyltransferase family protein n=1 Tax=Nocardioides sp. SYSU D00038 TaxID=2812554 RepID=UPI001966F5F9|nr:acyltransferase family protein [Nocardioides sp. SYSU D00038]